MIGLMQRVTGAEVLVHDESVGAVAQGLLVLVGVQRNDDETNADRLLQRLLTYRVFPDENRRMNLSLRDVDGGLLLVPQFTLAADTKSGTRPGFSRAAAPDDGRRLFEYLLGKARRNHAKVASGRFGADMQVALVNDGPVTFWLEC